MIFFLNNNTIEVVLWQNHWIEGNTIHKVLKIAGGGKYLAPLPLGRRNLGEISCKNI
jgi:hypothetical protein